MLGVLSGGAKNIKPLPSAAGRVRRGSVSQHHKVEGVQDPADREMERSGIGKLANRGIGRSGGNVPSLINLVLIAVFEKFATIENGPVS
jgi:hypothetical protein